ncbi:putative Co/Zn/Cd efflux system membrane fusion protein [Arcticibacter svalbardensis MN12-7]|uniref:Putative Co/Zn/Cd efflux system membrane fusion protein n=1 Tax=Arcticibacter svalbardensis MN12-7 TaxID=1150600 RepID=R9GTY4_9SPHI|nr:DUF3347 domain-containing protein [Arcticibacter svalbardensis]EOR95146.1 putative Co/Zn/Cd efflux system membrane fusion protein [Arcticibacter svalbardensis MN12-7]
MKRNYFVKTLMSLAFMVFITLVACSSDTKTNQSTPAAETSNSKSIQSVQPVFSDSKVKQVYSSYILLKNAVFNANVRQVKLAAQTLKTALTAVASPKGIDLSNKMANAPSLEVQRGLLTPLSAEVEKIIKASKLSSGIVYKQFCPMANNGEGGYWLASESTIKNPYYGDQMSSCGSVEEEIN